jgi:hypothetical protein
MVDKFMKQTRLTIAFNDINEYFKNTGLRIFKRSDIDLILSKQRQFWRLAENTTTGKFIEFLKEKKVIQEYKFEFPGRKEVRYVWENQAIDLEIINSVRPNSYFTHFTAMYLHGLTLQEPKMIYLNYEQPEKRFRDTDLAQERIDYAFRSGCRTSNNIADFGDRRICLLNGKYTGHKGIIDYEIETGHIVKTTNIERTLIDITVRPVYSGGVHSVLEAYRMAGDRLSVNKLSATLASLKYIYPYHQAIGFYLERAGVFTEKQLALIDKFDKNIDFYLVHQIREKEYSKRWKIYYPKGL